MKQGAFGLHPVQRSQFTEEIFSQANRIARRKLSEKRNRSGGRVESENENWLRQLRRMLQFKLWSGPQCYLRRARKRRCWAEAQTASGAVGSHLSHGKATHCFNVSGFSRYVLNTPDHLFPSPWMRSREIAGGYFLTLAVPLFPTISSYANLGNNQCVTRLATTHTPFLKSQLHLLQQ